MATIIEVCNIALDIIGHGGRLDSLDAKTPEAEACKLHFQSTYETCLDAANWSFARRDEVIDPTDLMSNIVALPYRYAYKLPKDVMRVLYLTELHASSFTETIGYREPLQFNFRNYNGQKVLTTDQPPSFVVQYQAYVDFSDQVLPTFSSALSYILASKLASSLVRGTEGLNMATKLYQLGQLELNKAAGFDAQQGASSVDNNRYSSFLEARR